MSKKGLTDEQWNKIGIIVGRELEERANDFFARKDSVMNDFYTELKEVGFKFDNYIEADILCEKNSDKIKSLVFQFYKRAIYFNEKAAFVDLLVNKKNKDLIPFFINELYNINYCMMGSGLLRDSIGNFLLETSDVKYKYNYVQLLTDNRVSEIWPYITIICGKLKLQEAVQPMLDIIDEKNMTGFVLDALNKYKNPEFLPIFKKYENDKVTRYRNAAKKGIKTIEKVLEKENK